MRLHHTIEAYSSLARQWIQQAGDCTTWAHDMDAAYRQLAVRDVQFSFVLLTTPFGHTLWRHNALCFGATASVWAFNRVADSVMHIGRQLLAAPILHYVDDFGGCEPAESEGWLDSWQTATCPGTRSADICRFIWSSLASWKKTTHQKLWKNEGF